MEQALKPCPFCGGSGQIVNGGPGNTFVRCRGCFAASDDRSREAAINAWNRRAPTEQTGQKPGRAVQAGTPTEEQSGETNPVPTAIEASPVVGEIEAVAWMDDGSLRAGSTNTGYRVVTDQQKRGMPTAVRESFKEPLVPAASLASLQSENQALREEVERLTKERDEARRGDHAEFEHEPTWNELTGTWKARAEAAESQVQSLTKERDRAEEQVVSAWNAFGPPKSEPHVETAAQVYDDFFAAGGDIAEQIRCLESQYASSKTQVQSLTLKLEERDKALRGLLAKQGYGEPTTSSGKPLADDEVVNILCTMRAIRAARSLQSGGAEHA